MAEVNIPAELLDEAERFGLDVSRELNESREAIASWNEWVAKNGLPLGHHRQF